MKKALTIAGSDSSGGAGIQADLKTMMANNVFGMSAITALTAQNTTGVRSVLEVSEEFLKDEIDMVFEDIRPDAVKIGMVSSKGLIRVIGERLRYYKAENIVVDPVMVATSSAKLMKDDALSVLIEELFPIATLITPNIFEATIISGLEIKTKEDMVNAAKVINERFNVNVLLKGGHSVNDANDLLYLKRDLNETKDDDSENGKYIIWFEKERIDNPNTHGTGCTLSSAIASNLAKGYDIVAAVEKAKEYVYTAISKNLDLGHGSGPLMHNIKGFEN